MREIGCGIGGRNDERAGAASQVTHSQREAMATHAVRNNRATNKK
jgi:hypothetical protein